MKTHFATIRICSKQVAYFLIAIMTLASSLGMAQTAKNIKLNMDIHLDGVGNAVVNYDLSMPAKPYAMVKQTFGDAFHVIRSMETGMGWMELSNMDARFEDQLQSVVSHCEASGMLRTTGPGEWVFGLGGEADGWELLDLNDQQAIFANVSDLGFGAIRSYSRVHIPAGATDVDYDVRRGELTYYFEPESEEGGRVDTDHMLMGQPHIISSLAKVYGTEQSELFAARNLFTNTGQQTLSDYRVRFRIDGYSSWSSWKKCSVVYPGQTVLDYFYPVLDIDRIAELTGTRHAMIETEFEYRTADGKKVTDSDSYRVEILSRNEVVYSTRPSDENLNWFESFDLTPKILTCFTTGTDPVVQQFAGRISALAEGPASSLDSQDAIKFLDTMWRVLQSNHLSYQTSPGLTVNNRHGQHVKFARDVLRNRAGTCIDLSVLWASAAESVGLKPYIAVIPGHAFPIIELPNGNQLPIESTMIGSATLEQAVEKGLENLKEAQKSGLIILVDISELKNNQDVRSLDLPRLSEDVLAKWGYNLDELLNQETVKQTEPAETTPVVTAKPVAQQNPMVGIWKMAVNYNGVHVAAVAHFGADGTYQCIIVQTQPNGYRETTTEKGTYIDHGTHFEFHTNEGDYTQRYKWKNNGIIVEFVDLNLWLHFYPANGS